MTAPRIQTVNAVTMEHAETLIDVINERLIDTGTFTEGFAGAEIMTWPDDDVERRRKRKSITTPSLMKSVTGFSPTPAHSSRNPSCASRTL
jgi:hypothetical protein